MSSFNSVLISQNRRLHLRYFSDDEILDFGNVSYGDLHLSTVYEYNDGMHRYVVYIYSKSRKPRIYRCSLRDARQLSRYIEPRAQSKSSFLIITKFNGPNPAMITLTEDICKQLQHIIVE